MGANTSAVAVPIKPTVPGSKSAREVAQNRHVTKEYNMHKKLLGEGCFSRVLLAKHRSTQNEVAVKDLDKDSLEQGFAEVEVLHFLGRHDHIANMLGAFSLPKRMWIVLELCDGGDVYEYFQEFELNEERLQIAMKGLISALDYCHSRNIAHRDIKPDNILMKNNPHPHVYLSDFGSAVHFVSNEFRTDMVGTACYVSPEVIKQKYLPAAADMWSAGMTMFCLLAGEPAYDGPYEELTLQRVLTRKLILPPTVTKKLSVVGQNFLVSLVRRRLNDRLTAATSLQHRWLSEGAGADMQVPEPDDPATEFVVIV